MVVPLLVAASTALIAAAVAQQDQHQRDQVGGLLHAQEGRAGGGGEGPPTGGAAMAVVGVARNPDVPLPGLPPGRAVGVREELGGGVHAGSRSAVVGSQQPEGCPLNPPPCYLHPCHHGSLGCYLAS